MFLLMQSLILGQVTEYFTLTSPTPTQTRNVYLLATAMAVLLVVNLTNNGGCHYIGYKLGMLIRIACTTAIYQKVCTKIVKFAKKIALLLYLSVLCLKLKCLCLNNIYLCFYLFSSHIASSIKSKHGG